MSSRKAGAASPSRSGAAIGAAGSAVGPLVGGALTDLLGWRWFFFVNLPVAALTVVLVLAIVPESRDETARGPLDRVGFATITLGLAALVFGLQAGDDRGWASPAVLGALLSGAVPRWPRGSNPAARSR